MSQTLDCKISLCKTFRILISVSAADSVDTSGQVDGIHTQETISLGETQHIAGLKPSHNWK